MNEQVFTRRKKKILDLMIDYLNKNHLGEPDKVALNELIQLLNQYSFENRLEKKGLLAHTIIDSMTLEYSLSEKIILFDNDIV